MAKPPLITPRPLILLTDSLSTRVFFSSGIIEKCWRHWEGEVDVVSLFDVKSVYDYRQWLPSDVELDVLTESTLPGYNRHPQSIAERWDSLLDRRFGFYPLAVRFSIIHNYHLSRMKWGHKNSFLNTALAFPFPRSQYVYQKMLSWYYGSRRFIPSWLMTFMSSRTTALVPTNMQVYATQKYLLAADRLNIPIVGHIGSWDHPVGKGAVFNRCASYIVQNEYMREKLVSQHAVPDEKIHVTGWPQMDYFAQPQSYEKFQHLLSSYHLNPEKPCVLIAGNSEGNSPYEPHFVRRLVDWWRSTGKDDEYSLIFRPHPRDIIHQKWKSRFGFLMNIPGVYVQEASYADIDVISLLLQHVRVVITNAGTILLDSLVNDRPVVCVLYDEGGPPGSTAAINNVAGDHYRDLIDSEAFFQAYGFDSAILGLEEALTMPAKRAESRALISARIAGQVDGHAGDRVFEAIKGTLRSKI